MCECVRVRVRLRVCIYFFFIKYFIFTETVSRLSSRVSQSTDRLIIQYECNASNRIHIRKINSRFGKCRSSIVVKLLRARRSAVPDVTNSNICRPITFLISKLLFSIFGQRRTWCDYTPQDERSMKSAQK